MKYKGRKGWERPPCRLIHSDKLHTLHKVHEGHLRSASYSIWRLNCAFNMEIKMSKRAITSTRHQKKAISSCIHYTKHTEKQIYSATHCWFIMMSKICLLNWNERSKRVITYTRHQKISQQVAYITKQHMKDKYIGLHGVHDDKAMLNNICLYTFIIIIPTSCQRISCYSFDGSGTYSHLTQSIFTQLFY